MLLHTIPFVLASLSLARARTFDSACSSIGEQVSTIPNVTVFVTELVPAGTNLTFPDTDASCGTPAQLVQADICRITMNVATSNASQIHMESWLPRNWTGRFLSTGNGGLGGCIQYGDLAYTTSLGFATVGANNGHNGSSGASFENHPEVLADFAFRSIHTNVVVGKEITKTFYGTPHNTSYYLGCSTGGRQGLKSVQDFPEDFDGVVAGAPAADFNALIGWSGRPFNFTGPPSAPTFIPIETWLSTIHNDILAQCDELDGVKDNIIEDPNLCNYNPDDLLCQNGNTANCLTEAQIGTVKNIFTPFLDENGKLLFPRPQPGGENLGITMYMGTVFQFTSDWFRFVIFNSSFDPSTLTLADYEHAIALDPFNISTFNPDISAFKNRNGKLLTYHGQMDGLITPKNSERYYDLVASTLTNLDDFYRFFRIGGMSHCSGGDGAWQIGQVGGQGSGVSLDPERNVLTAMVRWVEEGIAPDTILGTKFVNDNLQQGVAFSRRHCRWPLRTTFVGGDSTQPDSWSCEPQ